MDTIIQMMLIVWGALVLFAWLLRNGMGFVGDALAGMTGFMLGKALGPGATLLEGRSGSASSSWIHHGLVWLFVGASITFVTSGLDILQTISTAYSHGVGTLLVTLPLYPLYSQPLLAAYT